jgi:transcription elongation factor GreA
MRAHLNFHLTDHGVRKIKSELKRLKEQHLKFSKMWRTNSAEPDDFQHSVELMEQTDTSMHIQELEKILKESKPIRRKAAKKAGLGAVIRISGIKGVQKVTLVESIEADPFNGYISADSPLGSALLGKKVGEEVTVDSPKGRQTFKILSIM